MARNRLRPSASPLYHAWEGMRQRCSPSGQRDKPGYVGVGCDPRWGTFEGFVHHQPLGQFEPGKVLGRFNDTGDYSPENTRWQTKTESSREAIERRMLRLDDGRFAADVAKDHGIPHSTWQLRISRGWDAERAVTEPPRPKRPSSTNRRT